MKLLSRKPRTRMLPHDAPTPVGVNVTVTRREAELERGLEFTRDPLLAAQIRNNLPGRPVSAELRACRHAAVLAQAAQFILAYAEARGLTLASAAREAA